MQRIKLVIEYDGTPFVGWQVQSNGPSVQAALESALTRLTGERVRVTGAGRTDSGVHALAQVASFAVERPLPVKAFRDGLNALLPPEIAVRAAEEMPLDFDALRSARGKTYRYVVLNSPWRRPLLRHRAWHVKFPLDLAQMQQAAVLAEGEHDFAAFCAAESEAKTTLRRVERIRLAWVEPEVLHLEFSAAGFLHQMVRRLTGVLVEIGRGAQPITHLGQLLETPVRAAANPTAPPQGLFQVEVRY